MASPCGGTGRRAGFKIQFPYGSASSILAGGTIYAGRSIGIYGPNRPARLRALVDILIVDRSKFSQLTFSTYPFWCQIRLFCQKGAIQRNQILRLCSGSRVENHETNRLINRLTFPFNPARLFLNLPCLRSSGMSYPKSSHIKTCERKRHSFFGNLSTY